MSNGTAPIGALEEKSALKTTVSAETTALAPAPKSKPVRSIPKPKDGLLRPALPVGDALKAWEEYQKLCQAVLNENDYIYYVKWIDKSERGYEFEKSVAFTNPDRAKEKAEAAKKLGMRDVSIQPSKKRSAWDKLAKFYNLTIPSQPVDGAVRFKSEIFEVGKFIVERRISEGVVAVTYQESETLNVVKASASVIVSAPNGRVAVGEATCSAADKKSGLAGFTNPAHTIPSTAYTRALCRAISRCIGTGEVSAEEMQDYEGPEQAEQPKSDIPEVSFQPAPADIPAAPEIAGNPQQATPVKSETAVAAAPTPPQAAAADSCAQDGGKPENVSSSYNRPNDNSTITPQEPPVALDSQPQGSASTTEPSAEPPKQQSEAALRQSLTLRVARVVSSLKGINVANASDRVRQFVLHSAGMSRDGNTKNVPTPQLQVVVQLLDIADKKNGAKGMADLIDDALKAGR